jgi:hypothetical protein
MHHAAVSPQRPLVTGSRATTDGPRQQQEGAKGTRPTAAHCRRRKTLAEMARPHMPPPEVEASSTRPSWRGSRRQQSRENAREIGRLSQCRWRRPTSREHVREMGRPVSTGRMGSAQCQPPRTAPLPQSRRLLLFPPPDLSQKGGRRVARWERRWQATLCGGDYRSYPYAFRRLTGRTSGAQCRDLRAKEKRSLASGLR